MIAGKTFRELRWMALAYLLILEALCVPVLLWWPDIYADLQRSSLFRSLPLDFAKRIFEGITDKDEGIAYRNWVAVMLFFRSCNLVGTAAAVLFGTGLFARERENQTFEFLLSRPIARGAILWQKLWPAALCTVLPLFVVNASALYWSTHIGEQLPVAELFLATAHAAVFLLFVLTLTAWASLRLRVQAHVAAAVGAFLVLQIGVYLTQRIRGFSLFRLVDFEWYVPVLAGNTPWWQMLDPFHRHGFTSWLLLATAACLVLAWRDLRRAAP
mgnify:FL=1